MQKIATIFKLTVKKLKRAAWSLQSYKKKYGNYVKTIEVLMSRFILNNLSEWLLNTTLQHSSRDSHLIIFPSFNECARKKTNWQIYPLVLCYDFTRVEKEIK